MRQILRALALVFVTSVVVPIVTAGAVLASFLFLPLPATLPEAREGVNAQISRIYDINGNQIGVFRQFDTTEPVTFEDIPMVLRQAVLAAEDRRFYEHGGVDLRATLRALWADLRSGEAVQGGSTLTQQYVKNTYVGNERSLTRKIREAVVATQLDRQLEKDEILYRYLDQVYLGEGAYGVGAAAETYFDKPVNDLSLSEAALLAGLIPAPSRYEPRNNPEQAELKRRVVLNSMLEENMISAGEHAEASAQTLWLAVNGPPPEGQPVTVVQARDQVTTAYPYFVNYVERYLSEAYGPDAVYTRGLEIYTTLDPQLQADAEAAVRSTLDGTAPPLEMALVSLEPGSGFVKALVGGRDFYAPGGQVNLALGTGGGGLGRQPGSTWKPFVLATALEQGITPAKTYSGRSGICFDSVPEPYCPQNYGGSSFGTIDLRSATKRSVNTVFVQLARDVGVEAMFETAKALGVTTANYSDQFGLASALGTTEVNPIDMASAYGVFAARGERTEPTPVVRVLDSQAAVLEDNTTPESVRVIKEVTADTMNDVLQGVFTPGGTANGRGIGRPAAGKTGTTDDSGDAWFVGYTPRLSTAVWMGYRDGRDPLVGIKGVRTVTGGTLPARTWQAYMEPALEGTEEIEFNEPAPITRVADEAKRRAQRGFDVGERRRAGVTDEGGTYMQELARPSVGAPTTTTTTTEPGAPEENPEEDEEDDDGGIFGGPGPGGPP